MPYGTGSKPSGPKSKKKAREENKPIVFIDESGLSQQPLVRRTWAPRGKTPVVRFPFNWKKLSVLVAVTTRLDLFFEFVPGAFNSACVLCVLVDLLAAMPDGFLLLWDGAPIHRSGEVKDFLARPDVRERLSVHPLPAYAPEFNPVELIFSYTKGGKDLANYGPTSIRELEETAGKVFATLAEDKNRIRSLLLGSAATLEEADVVN